MSEYELVLSFRCPFCKEGLDLVKQSFQGVVGRPIRLSAEATVTLSAEHRCIAKLAEAIAEDVQREQLDGDDRDYPLAE